MEASKAREVQCDRAVGRCGFFGRLSGLFFFDNPHLVEGWQEC
jgi:hypothetical protein